ACVNFHAQDRAGPRAEQHRQAASAGADFQHKIAWPQVRLADHQVEQVEIDEEALPELAVGPQAAGLEQFAQESLGLSGRRAGWMHHRTKSFSTYFAKRSTSKLTVAPGWRQPSVVTSSVCGISATVNPVAFASIRVRLMP